MTPPDYKTYIGDGVYAAFDGYGLVITSENGIDTTNTIVLEPSVWESLVKYVERLKERVAEPEPRDMDTPLRMDQDRRDVEEMRDRESRGI